MKQENIILILHQQYENAYNKSNIKRMVLIKAIETVIDSWIFDKYAIPFLHIHLKIYAKTLSNNKTLIKFLAEDEEQQRFYIEIFEKAVDKMDLKAILLKILKEMSEK